MQVPAHRWERGLQHLCSSAHANRREGGHFRERLVSEILYIDSKLNPGTECHVIFYCPRSDFWLIIPSLNVFVVCSLTVRVVLASFAVFHRSCNGLAVFISEANKYTTTLRSPSDITPALLSIQILRETLFVFSQQPRQRLSPLPTLCTSLRNVGEIRNDTHACASNRSRPDWTRPPLCLNSGEKSKHFKVGYGWSR